MEEQTNKEIKERFFQALDYLKERRIIRGTMVFCNKFCIDRRNLHRVKTHDNGTIKPCWLTWIVLEYGVSANWLLTGRGNIRYGDKA